jgi:hypothetical protein
MDEDEDRRQFASGAVYIQSLDLIRAIGDPLGLVDTMAREFAVADSAFDQLLTIRHVGGLVIRGIECGLVIVEEYWRIFHRDPCKPDGAFGDAIDTRKLPIPASRSDFVIG